MVCVSCVFTPEINGGLVSFWCSCVRYVVGGGYHMHIMCCGVRAAIVCDVQLIGRLSLVVVPCVAAVGAATPLWLMRLHKTGDTRKLINVNVPRLRLFISVKPNRAFDNRLEPEYSRNNEHAIESGGGRREFKEERHSRLIHCPRRVSYVLYVGQMNVWWGGRLCLSLLFSTERLEASRRNLVLASHLYVNTYILLLLDSFAKSSPALYLKPDS